MARPAAWTNGLSNSVIHGLPPCIRVTFSSTVFGAIFFTYASKRLRDFVRILVGHEPHADLRHRDGGNDGLRPFAGEPAEQAVHLEGRPRPDALERGVAAFAEQLRRAELLRDSAAR